MEGKVSGLENLLVLSNLHFRARGTLKKIGLAGVSLTGLNLLCDLALPGFTHSCVAQARNVACKTNRTPGV
jgi:hypothetical protein